MKKTPGSKKMLLHRETIRSLDAKELEAVPGASFVSLSIPIPTQSCYLSVCKCTFSAGCFTPTSFGQ